MSDANMGGQARDLGPKVMGKLRRTVERVDPDPVVILVLAGSPERGLGMSMWTALKGEDPESEAFHLVAHAIGEALTQKRREDEQAD